MKYGAVSQCEDEIQALLSDPLSRNFSTEMIEKLQSCLSIQDPHKMKVQIKNLKKLMKENPKQTYPTNMKSTLKEMHVFLKLREKHRTIFDVTKGLEDFLNNAKFTTKHPELSQYLFELYVLLNNFIKLSETNSNAKAIEPLLQDIVKIFNKLSTMEVLKIGSAHPQAQKISILLDETDSVIAAFRQQYENTKVQKQVMDNLRFNEIGLDILEMQSLFKKLTDSKLKTIYQQDKIPNISLNQVSTEVMQLLKTQAFNKMHFMNTIMLIIARHCRDAKNQNVNLNLIDLLDDEILCQTPDFKRIEMLFEKIKSYLNTENKSISDFSAIIDSFIRPQYDMFIKAVVEFYNEPLSPDLCAKAVYDLKQTELELATTKNNNPVALAHLLYKIEILSTFLNNYPVTFFIDSSEAAGVDLFNIGLCKKYDATIVSAFHQGMEPLLGTDGGHCYGVVIDFVERLKRHNITTLEGLQQHYFHPHMYHRDNIGISSNIHDYQIDKNGVGFYPKVKNLFSHGNCYIPKDKGLSLAKTINQQLSLLNTNANKNETFMISLGGKFGIQEFRHALAFTFMKDGCALVDANGGLFYFKDNNKMSGFVRFKLWFDEYVNHLYANTLDDNYMICKIPDVTPQNRKENSKELLFSAQANRQHAQDELISDKSQKTSKKTGMSK